MREPSITPAGILTRIWRRVARTPAPPQVGQVTLSITVRLPTLRRSPVKPDPPQVGHVSGTSVWMVRSPPRATSSRDRKSTRLNSSHGYISYAVFCLKDKD